MILKHDLLGDPRTSGILRGLPRTEIIIDVGPGIKPCPAFPCREHICLEPCEEYASHLEGWKPSDRNVKIIRGDATWLECFDREDATVLLLDVIEHMERGIGADVLKIVETFEHAAIFTPLGWHEQSGRNPDAWGLNGGYWQQHRSAWHPEDFLNWDIYMWKRWSRVKNVGAIMAIR